LCNSSLYPQFSRHIPLKFDAENIPCTGFMQLSLRKTYFLLGFFVGPAEFVNSQRVFSDEQPVRLDENGVGF